MDALISAQASIALLIEGSNLASIHAGSPEGTIPRSAEEAHLLFGDAQDLQVLEGVDRDQVVRRLTLEADSAEALQLCLILLDAELSSEIRSEAAEDLDALLAEGECREGLERILFAHPLPQEADLPGALAYSEQAARVQDFLGQLGDLQPSIIEVHRVWIGVPDSLFENSADRRYFQAVLVREGLFRGLSLVYRAGTPVEDLLLTARLNPALSKIMQEYFLAMYVLKARFRRHDWDTKWRALVEMARKSTVPLVENLTPRETEVFRLFSAGYSQRKIAESLGIALTTVRTHIFNIYHKFRARDRPQVVMVVSAREATDSEKRPYGKK